ncbi:MAG: cytochrome b [Pseudomonadota bacterium]
MSDRTMSDQAAPTSFPVISRILHALIGVGMIGLIALGWWMIDLSYYSSWYNLAPYLHKAFGVIVFFLGIALLVMRFIKARPPHLDSHTPLEKRASSIAHFLLIASVITIPVSGYLFTTFEGEGIPIFSLVTLPALFPVSETVRDLAISFHIYASYGLLAVIAAHAGGALKHHFIDKDRTLRRMTW